MLLHCYTLGLWFGKTIGLGSNPISETLLKSLHLLGLDSSHLCEGDLSSSQVPAKLGGGKT